MIEADSVHSTPRTDSSLLSRRHAIAGLALLPATIGIPVAAAAEPDPIFAVIQRHKELSAAYDRAVKHPDVGNDVEDSEAEEICARACTALLDHSDGKLIQSEPTTSAGVAALMRYVASLKDWEEPRDHRNCEERDDLPANWHSTFLGTLAHAVEKIEAVRT